MSKNIQALVVVLAVFIVGCVWVGASSFIQKSTKEVPTSVGKPTATSTAANVVATSTPKTLEAHDLCSAYAGQPAAPAIWRTATSSTGVVVTLTQNNLYVNGTKIVSDIPASLGLPPADDVALDPFFEGFQATTSCNYYSYLSLSPDGSKIALLYERSVLEHPTDAYATVNVSDLLVYSLKGKLILKKTLTWPQSGGSIASASGGDLIFPSNNVAIIDFSSGKEGDLGQPVLYRMDGTSVPLPYGMFKVGAVSPDGEQVLYDDQNSSSCHGVAMLGMTSMEFSALTLFNAGNRATTTVMCNPNIGFFPQSWSTDGTQALAITVSPDFKANGYIIYNTQTQNAQLNNNPGALDMLKKLCTTTFKCSKTDYFDASSLH